MPANLIPLPQRRNPRSTADLRAEMRELCLLPRNSGRDSKIARLDEILEARRWTEKKAA